jgi:hypothetical protein
MKEFFAESNEGAGKLQRQQALETVEFNIDWVKKREENVKESLLKL